MKINLIIYLLLFISFEKDAIGQGKTVFKYPYKIASVTCTASTGQYVISSREEFRTYCKDHTSINFFEKTLLGLVLPVDVKMPEVSFELVENIETKTIHFTANYFDSSYSDRKDVTTKAIWLVINKPPQGYQIIFDLINKRY